MDRYPVLRRDPTRPVTALRRGAAARSVAPVFPASPPGPSTGTGAGLRPHPVRPLPDENPLTHVSSHPRNNP